MKYKCLQFCGNILNFYLKQGYKDVYWNIWNGMEYIKCDLCKICLLSKLMKNYITIFFDIIECKLVHLKNGQMSLEENKYCSRSNKDTIDVSEK